MKKPPWPLALGSLGFALSPPLGVFASNAAELAPIELLRPALLTLLSALALAGLLFAALRRDGARATIAASALWLLFWNYPPLRELARALGSLLYPELHARPEPVGLPLFALAATLCIVGAARMPERAVRPLATALAAAGAALLLLALPWRAVRRSAPAPPTPVAPTPSVAEKKQVLPDLYIIVLDGYGREDVLKELYGVADPLASGLRARGFQVASRSRANYLQTALVIGALLRLDYWPGGLSGSAVEVLSRAKTRWPLQETLQAKGYRSVGYLSGGPTPLIFDQTFTEDTLPGGTFTALENLLLDRTPLVWLPRGEDADYARHRQRLRGALRGLATPPGGPEPQLIFCHLLAPHPPFVFAANGESLTPKQPFSIGDATSFRGSDEEYRAGYSGQVQWVGRSVLSALDTLSARSKRPAAFLILGDHGPRRFTDWSSIEETYLPEAMGNLLAVKLPPTEAARFGALEADATPLPTLRRLLSAVTGVRLPARESRSYYSTLQRGFDFTEVSAAAAQPPRQSDAHARHPR